MCGLDRDYSGMFELEGLPANAEDHPRCAASTDHKKQLVFKARGSLLTHSLFVAVTKQVLFHPLMLLWTLACSASWMRTLRAMEIKG